MATTSTDRIVILDLIRGVAVLAIFSINIAGMAFFQPVYFQPSLQGFERIGDKLTWLGNFVFVEQKMRALFSILFGASMMLVIDRAVEKGRAAWSIHFPRMIWLLLFGLVHYYVFWWGDILHLYALTGMIAFFFWRIPAPWLAVFGAILLAYYPLSLASDVLNASDPPAPTMATSEPLLPSSLIEADVRKHDSPATHLQSMIENDPWRPWDFFISRGPQTLGYIFLGMALLRLGFLSGSASDRTYRQWSVIALAGLACTALLAWWVAAHDYQPPFVSAARLLGIGWMAAPMAIGYAALIILVFRRSHGWLGVRLAAAGRMAFTCYLGSTLLTIPFLFGFGFGLYGELSRGEAWFYFLPPIWLIMLVGSKWWLDRFRYGPLEWAWRSLARFALQPMRKS